MTPKTLVFSGISIFALMFPVHAEDILKTLDVEPNQTLNLRTDSGKIEVSSHDDNTVIVDVTIERKSDSDDFDVTIEQEGDEIIIVGEKDGSNAWGGWRGPKVHFDITVPKDFNLDLKTAGGAIYIDEINGTVEADTSGGSITAIDITGDTNLHTSGGSIKTENIYGEIDAHTSGGSIKMRFDEQLSDSAKYTTSGGSITAYLPSDIRIDLQASTSGGRVSTDFDIDGRVKKRSIKGEINGGGPELKLRTSGGSVRINSN